MFFENSASRVKTSERIILGLSLALFLVLIVPHFAQATLFDSTTINLRDKSETHSISLEYGDDIWNQFRKKFTPNLENGFLQIKGIGFSLSSADTKSTQLGKNAFSVKNNYFALYGSKTTDNYRLYYHDGISLNKIILEKFTPSKTPVAETKKSETIDETTKSISVTPSKESEEIITQPRIIMISAPRIGYIEQPFYFSVKVFEEGANVLDKFSNTNGIMFDAKISANIISPSGQVVYSVNGLPNDSGVFRNFWMIPFRTPIHQDYTLEVISGADVSIHKLYVESPIRDSGNSTKP